MGSLNLKLGVWRLQPWDKNFYPYSQKNTSAQVWVHFWDLPWVYWHPQILDGIARAIGVPLRLDNATINGDYGHYALILVDTDLKNPLLYHIKVDSDGDCGFVNVEYENVHDFCTTFSSTGHPATHCKLNKPKEDHGAHVHSGKAVGKKTVFRDDSKSDDLDKENEDNDGADGVDKVKEDGVDGGESPTYEAEGDDFLLSNGALDHYDHTKNKQVCDGEIVQEQGVGASKQAFSVGNVLAMHCNELFERHSVEEGVDLMEFLED